jgi:hypothetical protein
MDPYLEHPGRWPDVHHRLISIASDLLTAQLRPKYYVRVEERVYLSDQQDPGRTVIIPDMRVVAASGRQRGGSIHAAASAVATIEPVIATTLFDEEIHEARLEVIDRELRSVVTVIEVLSPTNKCQGSRGQRHYQEKRLEVMRSPSHFVEIDLLRAGTAIEVQQTLPAHEYLVHVSRFEDRPKGKLWPIPLQGPLPQIEIPLRTGDAPAMLDLQKVLTTAYDGGAYDLDIDYCSDPVPPLSTFHAEWAVRLLKEKGLRSLV